MIKTLRYLLSCALFLSVPLLADDAQGDVYASEKLKAPSKLTPFGFKANYDYLEKSNFDKKQLRDQRLRFGLAQAEVSAIFYYDPCITEGANVSLGYTNNLLDWSENPFFNQTHFNTIDLSLGFFSKRLENWFWQVEASINFDTDHWNFSDYTYYDITFWGRYNYSKNVGIHIGALIETGMKMDRVYPIFGFDWAFWNKWKLSVIYPVNISLVYQWTKAWSFSAATRFFDVRHRASRHSQLSKALVRYTNFGGEFMVRYDHSSNLWADVHVGYAAQAMFRIANKNNNHARHFRVDPTPYLGAEMGLRF